MQNFKFTILGLFIFLTNSVLSQEQIKVINILFPKTYFNISKETFLLYKSNRIIKNNYLKRHSNSFFYKKGKIIDSKIINFDYSINKVILNPIIMMEYLNLYKISSYYSFKSPSNICVFFDKYGNLLEAKSNISLPEIFTYKNLEDYNSSNNSDNIDYSNSYGILINYFTVNYQNNTLEFYDINDKLIGVEKYKPKKNHVYLNSGVRYRNKFTLATGTFEYYEDGVFYIFDENGINSVRFYDAYRDRDESSPGP